jgi:hypothetical protein
MKAISGLSLLNLALVWMFSLLLAAYVAKSG